MCPNQLGYPPTCQFKCACSKAAGNVKLSNYMHLVPRKITNVTIPTLVRDSSVSTATRYKLDGQGIEPGGGARFSATVQTGPGAHPASYTMCTASFPGLKRPGRGVGHPSPSSAEVKGRVELYIFSPFGPSWTVLGWPLSLRLTIRPLPANDTMLSTGTTLS